ncbi:3-oxoacyl-acyl-carrier-protein synthase, KASI [Moraxella catarrhalis]|uniref:beta-ketoacyl synthase N-terminal-like domain-containing protein n=1 Tax=Moraxella catarrhalis TaxID=480 RepID=UPI0007E3BB30|nr:beta-ketoacyl synthase N-terminal-like domain-containing protein [Moraxella catarrhalis]OAV09931.1 3-oxoacyl-acyl-carrier-protein synthase, KASI [Moraxella catarrhalis]OAV26401.1 3-oxoacyl-acyl-carrier-protein synthase, KASI [Moraxella catarrhalis]OAV33024.1 3-oxoacyl-acyl-carrier-protein synthase, KASI [Moraxella catarrhalis]RKM22935.1 beta-ketoacyl-ACP synthase I [Moraxella catarrhalis]STY80524.1 3-oxoacyl-[acyl-carrier-protein] synthase 1 [Moraxella catarrhalis]
MKRVVITGAGIVSCLGNDLDTVKEALENGRSGIRFKQEYADLGFKSCVAGSIDHDDLDTTGIDRKLKRFMSNASLYAYISALSAIKNAGLSIDTIADNPRVSVVAASGGASTADVVAAVDAMREKGLRGVGAMAVPKIMASSVSATLATGLKIKGLSYSLSSACATSSHCVGHAMELIQLGKADIVLAGGGESEHWTQSCMFDAMGAMSTQYSDTPQSASRPYDKDRDGFVIAGGGGMVVVESLESAQSRGATILAEITGYGATSDGAEMVAPSGEGAVRCMQIALAQAGLASVDYINSHGTSTPLGDITELNAIATVFGGAKQTPPISSTKSMTGHSLGAVGTQELIYCLLMMNHEFIAPTINVQNLDDAAKDFDIVTQTRPTALNSVMSNSFGFGGTNAALVIQKFNN